MEITNSEGYQKLLSAVEDDEEKSPGFHDYRGKLNWIIERVNHYAEKTGIPASDLLDEWENHRNYWYMNYYQDSNQPLLDDSVKVFDTVEEFIKSVDDKGFRCPVCKGHTKDPYTCKSGIAMNKKGDICDWKSYGFLKASPMASIFIKEARRGERLFMPIAWE